MKARDAGAEVRGNDFTDPWGNNVQLMAYGDVQFTKTPEILAAMVWSSRRPRRPGTRSDGS